MAIKFREIKQYISRTAPISICFRNGHYDNYLMISDIPEGRYDDMYVYGVGMIDVEFPLDVYKRQVFNMQEMIRDGVDIRAGLEIVVQEEPREIIRHNKDTLQFQDLRGYLQIGRNFSVVMREDWSAENYVWKRDIPSVYDELYMYGIGMEELPYGLRYPTTAKEIDMAMNKQMVLVLAKLPRVDVE